MSFEVGKVYRINHRRKGIFVARVDSLDDVWANVTILDGKTQTMNPDNASYEGESLSIRISFCQFEELKS